MYANQDELVATLAHYLLKPEITSHVVDDVFLSTITEKKTIEDIERHKCLVNKYRHRPRSLTLQYATMPEAQWENFSDISSASRMTLTPKMERMPLLLPPQNSSHGRYNNRASPYIHTILLHF
ncbi:unnamed protein product [Diatraea saccharalis]|uniref:Uncharacterized protein n=1 Tax=Diatraea saccharalis TaxID=40085 RepID=A0A9N9MZW5_9NEOP|nr:unnamed protein product [Diatraea saccharalis]